MSIRLRITAASSPTCYRTIFKVNRPTAEPKTDATAATLQAGLLLPALQETNARARIFFFRSFAISD